MATFTSKINGNDIYAKRAEATRKGVNLETYGEGESQVKGILPTGLLPGNEGTNDANILATQQYVLDQMEVADALMYKGTVNSNSDLPDGSTAAKEYKTGWTYKVATADTYAGKVCEAGDMIIANKDWASGATQNNDWDVVQANIDGAVVNNSPTATNNAIAVFDNSGRVIKDSQVIIETTLSASSDANVPTSKAVNTAITNAVNALDATVDSTTAAGENTNVAVQVVEADGIITGVTITKDDTINATDLSNAIDALDVNDLVQDTEGSMAGQTLKTLSETDGKITATFQDIKITSDKVTDRQTSSFDGNADTLTTGTAVKAAIDALDVSNISGFGAGKTLATLTETDGKIAATFQDIAITGAQVTVASATNGNFAGLDASGHVVDSGKKATDFKPVQTAVVDPTASGDASAFIATISQDANGVITATKANLPIAAPTSGGVTHPGLVTYETIDL